MCVHTTPAYTMSPGCPADRLAKFGEYCEFLRIFCTTCMANSVYSGAGAFNTAAAGASALAAHSH